MSVLALPMSWTDQGTSIRMDTICLTVALAMHIPLFFMRYDFSKSVVDRQTEKLVAVDLIDPAAPKPAPAPKVAKEPSGLFSKLKKLVRNDPPPPPKKLDQPKKIDLGPKEIKLDPSKMAKAQQPKLQSKSGFKTAANPELVKQEQIKLKSLGAGVAPLSSKKLGTTEDRTKVKSDRGNFKIASNSSLSGIGGGAKGGLVDPGAPTISINTGKSGSREKFSAPTTQKADKGSFAGGNINSLGKSDNLSLRDRMIARDAAPTKIGNVSGQTGGVTGGVPGGTVGGVGTKKDAGRSFQSSNYSVAGGQGVGGTGTSTLAGQPGKLASKPRKREKKKLFDITGPLKDRTIVKPVLPDYPSWAQAQGIEAAVILQFSVLPNGKVKYQVVVRRTSGYPRLDNEAIKALRSWQFAPLKDGSNRTEVGTITFNFTLQ